MPLAPIPPCSLQELQRWICNNLTDYDYKSPRTPDVLAHISRTPLETILVMLKDLETRGFISVSWSGNEATHEMAFLNVKRRDHTSLPNSPYEVSRTAEEQTA